MDRNTKTKRERDTGMIADLRGLSDIQDIVTWMKQYQGKDTKKLVCLAGEHWKALYTAIMNTYRERCRLDAESHRLSCDILLEMVITDIIKTVGKRKSKKK